MVLSSAPAARAGAAMFCALTAAAGPAHATDFHVSGGITRGLQPYEVLGTYDASDGVQIGRGINHDEFGPGQASWHAQADSLADITGVHAHTFASVLRPSGTFVPVGGQYISTAFAQGSFTDFFIPGTPGTTVTASLRFHVDGSQDQGTSAGTDGRHLVSSTAVLLTFSTPGGSDFGLQTLSVTNGDPVELTQGGMMIGFDGDDTLVTMPFVLPVGEFFTVQMEMSASTSLNYNSNEPTFQMQGNLDYADTVSFATDGPVFMLPDGFTVNSPSAGVVDNRYVAPAPSVAMVLGLAMGAVGARRRRDV